MKIIRKKGHIIGYISVTNKNTAIMETIITISVGIAIPLVSFLFAAAMMAIINATELKKKKKV